MCERAYCQGADVQGKNAPFMYFTRNGERYDACVVKYLFAKVCGCQPSINRLLQLFLNPGGQIGFHGSDIGEFGKRPAAIASRRWVSTSVESSVNSAVAGGVLSGNHRWPMVGFYR